MLKYIMPTFILVVALLAQQVWSADLTAALDAFKRNDFEAALREFRPAAEHGDAVAQFYMGVLYANGQGVPRDDAQALKWYLKAAEQGDMSAQYNTGVFYNQGRGVRQNNAEALKWFQKAAAQGDRVAEYNIAVIYREALKDYAKAKDLFAKLAMEGMPEAQDSLGVMYANGEGMPQDYTEAYIWFYVASAYGLELAKQHRDMAAKFLNDDERLNAELTAVLLLGKLPPKK